MVLFNKVRNVIGILLISIITGCGILHGPDSTSRYTRPTLYLWWEDTPDSVMTRDTTIYDGLNFLAASEPDTTLYWRLDYIGQDGKWYVVKEDVARPGQIAGSTWIVYDEETLMVRFIVWIKNRWDRVTLSDTLYHTHVGKGYRDDGFGTSLFGGSYSRETGRTGIWMEEVRHGRTGQIWNNGFRSYD